MKIELTKISDSSIGLSISNNSSSEDFQVWTKILTDVILLTCLNRQIFLVTIDPTKESIGYEFKSEKLIYLKRAYLLNDIQYFRVIDALNIGDSADWQLGLTILLFPGEYKIKEINISKLFPKTEEDILSIQQSVLFCTNDGCSLYWLNFELTFNDVVTTIKKIISAYQTELSIIA